MELIIQLNKVDVGETIILIDKLKHMKGPNEFFCC